MVRGHQRIATERKRQMSEKKYYAKCDDTYTTFELVEAASAYLHAALVLESTKDLEVARSEGLSFWPWDNNYFKVSIDPSRNLEKAGGLIAAEMDRLYRLNRKAEKELQSK